MATGRENRFIPLVLRFGKSNRDLFWRKTEKFKLQREPKLDYWKLPLGLQVLERRRRLEACAGSRMTLSVGGSGVGALLRAQTSSSVRCSGLGCTAAGTRGLRPDSSARSQSQVTAQGIDDEQRMMKTRNSETGSWMGWQFCGRVGLAMLCLIGAMLVLTISHFQPWVCFDCSFSPEKKSRLESTSLLPGFFLQIFCKRNDFG